MNRSLVTAAVALAASGVMAATAPAISAPIAQTAAPAAVTGAVHANAQDRWAQNDRDGRYDGSYRRGDRSGYRDEQVSRNSGVWRDSDGRYRCRRSDGTTGLLIGGAAGGVLGDSIAGRGDRTLGTILGLAGGALLGRAIDRSNSRCR